MSFKEATLIGTAQEAGIAQGKHFSSEIESFFEILPNLTIGKEIRLNFLPYSLVYPVLKWLTNRHFIDTLEKHVPDSIAYLHGLAEGSHRDFEDILFFSLANVLKTRLAFFKKSFRLDYCSTVALADFSCQPACLIGKNFDYPLDLQDFLFITKLNVTGKHKVIGHGMIPTLALAQGVNEKGLGISLNNAHALEESKIGVPLSIMVQEALLNCASTTEAVHFFQSTPLGNSGIITIGDIDGELIKMEISPSQLKLKRGTRLVATNHYQSSSMKKLDAYHSQPSSTQRYARLQQLTHQPTLSIANMKNILRDCGSNQMPGENTICRFGAMPTIASAIIDCHAKEYWGLIGSPLTSRYQKYSFDF
ncbi:MAG TPA: C45 family peptidase [Vitreimonas sp.]|nr:C45 family peptidase [Vitreimonas sp.]